MWIVYIFLLQNPITVWENVPTSGTGKSRRLNCLELENVSPKRINESRANKADITFFYTSTVPRKKQLRRVSQRPQPTQNDPIRIQATAN